MQNTYATELFWLLFVLLTLMMLGRAAFVFPLSFVHNWWAREQLSVQEMVVIWCVAHVKKVHINCDCQVGSASQLVYNAFAGKVSLDPS